MKMYMYLHSFVDRHGKPRNYFRKDGVIMAQLPDDIDSPEFEKAYRKVLSSLPSTAQQRAAEQRERAKRAEKHQPIVGVYLLMLKGEIIYIGSSMDMPSRVKTHRTNGRQFDRAFYIGTLDNERLTLEAALIRAFRPPQNYVGVRQPKPEKPREPNEWDVLLPQGGVETDPEYHRLSRRRMR